MVNYKTIIFAGLSLALTALAQAQPYVPSDDNEVLVKVTITTQDRERISQLQGSLTADNNSETAINLAKMYVGLGRLNADPRYYGYAEAMLGPLLSRAKTSPDALLLKAIIQQNRHDFLPAIKNLNSALNLNPRLAQAWLTLASIHEAQGDYPKALQSCLALTKLTTGLSASVCLNSALSLSGQASYAYRQFTRTLVSVEASSKTSPEELSWALTTAGEMAERLGLTKEADSWYQKALATKFRSMYLLATYADFLLAQNKPQAVINQLANETQVDNLLLRLCLAEQRLQHPNYRQHADELKARILASQNRGNSPHQGDEARFFLEILRDQNTALKLAETNWQAQKEPRDAAILMATSLAVNNLKAAEPALHFLEQNRLEDVRLNALVKQLKSKLKGMMS